MSNTIDTRVVEMKFDNAQFERGIATTLRSLSVLEKGLQLKGAANGLNEVNKAASGLSLGNIASNVQSIASRFSALGIIGVTALASVARQAVSTGTQMLKSLTTQPIADGLREYETNLNSIQTILANTGLEGKAGLQQVTGALNELNRYSDQTIYNFSEMAKNIGTFTAAGIKLEPATAAIKGIANLAAISGSNAEQASSAMYQLSQAMAAGKATLVDWNSVVNAGMGGKVFQEALKDTARVQGKNIDEIIKKNGSFRDSLQEGWLTTKVLTDTLAKFTGDLNAQQLKSMGYNDAQIKGIMKMGKTAQEAATKVKTVSQLIGTLQEAVGSGWSTTFQTLFGDFDEARTLFTNVSKVLGGFIQKSSQARNKVLGDWKALGGRTVLIKGIAIAFNNVMDVLTPIKKAFRDIFPPTTGKQLYDLTVRFTNFMASMRLNEKTMDNIRRTFRGVFAVFDIGIQILKGLGTVVATVFKSFSGGSGGILEFTGNIGDWLVALDKAIKSGKGFHQFFVNLGNVIRKPIEFLKNFLGVLKDVVGGVKEFGSAGADKIAAHLEPLGLLGKIISKAWSGVIGLLKGAYKAFSPLADKFQEFFHNLGDTIKESLGATDFSSILDGINTGLLAGLVLLLHKFFKSGLKLDFGGGLLESITGAFEGLTGTMKAMQTQLKAGALLKIAGAIALLTVSVVALSLIDPKRLSAALGGLAVMFTELLGAMAIFEKIVASGGFLKMPFMTASLILLAAAIDILVIAVAKLATLSWEELAKGLTGVAVLLASLALFTKFADVEKGGIKSAAGLLLLAFAIKTLVTSVQDLSGMSWQELAKGLVGVATILGALALFTKFSAADKGGVAQGAGIILLALGIKILATALKDLGQLSWEEIGKGLVAMAGGLALMGAALYLVPPSSILSAAAIFIVAQSLSTIGDAIKQMGGLSWGEIAKGITTMAGALILIAGALALLPPSSLLSAAAIFVVAASLGMIADALGTMGAKTWGEIAKGLVTLAASLGIIAAALYLMTAALPGAAALLVAAAALRVLTPVLQALGAMSWESIAKGLATLAGVFVILGAAGLVLAPLVPVLLGLGAAITLLGVGMLAAGGGLLLFSAGLTALSVSGAAGAAVLVNVVKQLAMLIPFLMTQLGLGVIAFAKVISTAGPQFTKALVVILTAMLNAIDKMAPKIVATLVKLLGLLLAALQHVVPKLVQAGSNLVVSILNGFAKNVPRMATAATNLIVTFLNAIGSNLPRVIQAGVNLVLSFVNGVANAIRNNSSAMGAAGANLGSAIVEGMVRGLAGGIGSVTSKAREIASSALSAAKGVLGIHSPSKEFEKIGKFVNEGFVKGLDGNKEQIDASFKSLRDKLIEFQKAQVTQVNTLEARLKKLRSARKQDKDAILETVRALALARAEWNKAHDAQIAMDRGMRAQHTFLDALSKRYDVLTDKIKAANDALVEAKRVRDDYAKSVIDQYSDLPTPGDDQHLADFIAQGKKQVEDEKILTALLMKARGLGLNDDAYKDLLAKGTAGIPFLQELIASGKSGVNEINKIDSDLNKVGGALGRTAAYQLYQAGVNSAQGLVDGLKKQQAAIEKQMDIIAAAMVKSIKKQLGIKSPSRVFAEIGRYTVQGMAIGLERYSGLVDDSVRNVGESAVDTLRKSISGITDVLTTDANFNPVVRPVLDLTDVRTDAGKLADILKATPLKVDASLAKAQAAAAGYNKNQADQRSIEVQKETPSVKFEQNNYSPKALTPTTIYRNTKNQLSVAKGVLTGNAN